MKTTTNQEAKMTETLARAAELADTLTPYMKTQDDRERMIRIAHRLWSLT